MTKLAAFLIGSPRGVEKSNSGRYAERLAKHMRHRGWQVRLVPVHEVMASSASCAGFVQTVWESDLAVIVAPLYVDALPGPVVEAFQVLAEERTRFAGQQPPRLAALIHCGFVEPSHNRWGIEMCRLFARKAGWEWFGALALGGGGMPSRRAHRVVDDAGRALAGGLPIHEELRRRGDRPSMPRLLYILGGNLMWRRVAKRNGLDKKDLLAQPYD